MAPIDIRVDGLSVGKLTGPAGALSEAAQLSLHSMDSQSEPERVILFTADTSSSAAMKNVIINGFEIDTPDPRLQARQPFPADGDEHADADSDQAVVVVAGGERRRLARRLRR